MMIALYISLTSFNSRTPGGVRRTVVISSTLSSSFNSRTPGGVRLDSIFSVRFDGTVSIHAPREGCDA